MDADAGGFGVPDGPGAGEAVARDRDPTGSPIRYGPEIEDEVVRRVAAGESVCTIAQTPGMPSRQAVLRWTLGARPGFADRLDEARAAAGRRFDGKVTGLYCQETAERIFLRLCDGESMKAICRDADMPHRVTAYRWMKKHAEFRRQIGLAREIQADTLGAEGWEMAQAATPETACLTHVQLTHLRWYASRLSPRKFGATKAVEWWAAEGEDGPPEPPEPVFTAKSFWVETSDDGRKRVWSRYYDPELGRIVDGAPGEWSRLSPAQTVRAMPPGPERTRLAESLRIDLSGVEMGEGDIVVTRPRDPNRGL